MNQSNLFAAGAAGRQQPRYGHHHVADASSASSPAAAGGMADEYLFTILHRTAGGRQLLEQPLEASVHHDGARYVIGNAQRVSDDVAWEKRVAIAKIVNCPFYVTALYNADTVTAHAQPYAFRYYVRPALARNQIGAHRWCEGEDALIAVLHEYATAVVVEPPWIRRMAIRTVPAVSDAAAYTGPRRVLAGVGVGALMDASDADRHQLAMPQLELLLARALQRQQERDAAEAVAEEEGEGAAGAQTERLDLPTEPPAPLGAALLPQEPVDPLTRLLLHPWAVASGTHNTTRATNGGNEAYRAPSSAPLLLLDGDPHDGKEMDMDDEDADDGGAGAGTGAGAGAGGSAGARGQLAAAQLAARSGMYMVEQDTSTEEVRFQVRLVGNDLVYDLSHETTLMDGDDTSSVRTVRTWTPNCGVLQAPPGAGRRRMILASVRPRPTPPITQVAAAVRNGCVYVSSTLVVCPPLGVDKWAREARDAGLRACVVHSLEDFTTVGWDTLDASDVVILALPCLAWFNQDERTAVHTAIQVLNTVTPTPRAVMRAPSAVTSVRARPASASAGAGAGAGAARAGAGAEAREESSSEGEDDTDPVQYDRARRWLVRVLATRFASAHVPWTCLWWRRVVVDDADNSLISATSRVLAHTADLRGTHVWLTVVRTAFTRRMPLDFYTLYMFRAFLGLPVQYKRARGDVLDPCVFPALQDRRLVHLRYSNPVPMRTEGVTCTPAPAEARLTTLVAPRPPGRTQHDHLSRTTVGLLSGGVSFASYMARTRPVPPAVAARLLHEHYTAAAARATPAPSSLPHPAAHGGPGPGTGTAIMEPLVLGPPAAVPAVPGPEQAAAVQTIRRSADFVNRIMEQYGADSGSRPTCLICGDDDTEADTCLTVCGHVFCVSCAEQTRRVHAVHATTHSTPCPSCKQPLTSFDWIQIQRGTPAATPAATPTAATPAPTPAPAATTAEAAPPALPAKVQYILDVCHDASQRRVLVFVATHDVATHLQQQLADLHDPALKVCDSLDAYNAPPSPGVVSVLPLAAAAFTGMSRHLLLAYPTTIVIPSPLTRACGSVYTVHGELVLKGLMAQFLRFRPVDATAAALRAAAPDREPRELVVRVLAQSDTPEVPMSNAMGALMARCIHPHHA